MQSCIKCKNYHDKKQELRHSKKKYCGILQPRVDHQGSTTPCRDFRWVAPYVIQNLLPNDNYVVRLIKRNKT